MLDTVTVKGVPEAPGVALAGATWQVGGGAVAAAPQLKFTELLYPLIAVNLPLNCAGTPAVPVKGEFAIVGT